MYSLIQTFLSKMLLAAEKSVFEIAFTLPMVHYTQDAHSVFRLKVALTGKLTDSFADSWPDQQHSSVPSGDKIRKTISES